MKKNIWKHYRTKWVLYNGKKVKLRHYIAINSIRMKAANKPGWQKKDHYSNYKKAVCFYGLAGLKHYENRFYKGIPMPNERSGLLKFYYRLKTILIRIKYVFRWIVKL